MKPRKGSLAICGLGTLGLITENEPREITYPDGKIGLAYVGIHLTDKISPIGSPWSSRHPMVIGHTDDYESVICSGKAGGHIFLFGKELCQCGSIRKSVMESIEKSLVDHADVWKALADS